MSSRSTDIVAEAFLGKPVCVDGVKIGYSTGFAIRVDEGAYPVVHLDLVVPQEELNNLREYLAMMSVMRPEPQV